MKKWIAIAVVVVGGFLVWQQWPELWGQAGAEDSVKSRPTTAVVERRSIYFNVSAAGEIVPAEQVSVRPEVNGKIKTLPVDIGDRVKQGEVLFTLDDSDLQIEKQSRETEIAGARLQLEKTKRNYERSQELYEAELISQELYEDTKTEYELAKNALDRAMKNLALVEERIQKTVIVAPFDCTVLTRPVSVGQAVSGSGGFNSGTEVLTIADLNQMIINAHVNQVDVTRLSVGQEVDIEVESVPGLTMKGTVERVAPQSTIKNSIKGYAARIRIDQIDPRVRPGMTANVSIPVASSEDALAVPLAAVFTEQGERYAYVVKGNTFERRPLQIGIADYDYAEVLSGLEPGDVVSLEDPSLKLRMNAAQGLNTFAARPGEKRTPTSPLAQPGGERPRGNQTQTAEARPAGGGTAQTTTQGQTGSRATAN